MWVIPIDAYEFIYTPVYTLSALCFIYCRSVAIKQYGFNHGSSTT